METKLRVGVAYTNVDTLEPMDFTSIKQMREAMAEQSMSERMFMESATRL